MLAFGNKLVKHFVVIPTVKMRRVRSLTEILEVQLAVICEVPGVVEVAAVAVANDAAIFRVDEVP